MLLSNRPNLNWIMYIDYKKPLSNVRFFVLLNILKVIGHIREEVWEEI